MIKIQGKKYIFEVDSHNDNGAEDFCFYIKATCKNTGRFSGINNLNTVLSELGVNPDDDKFADSSWVVTKDEAHEFVDATKRFLSDSSFLDYLEIKLDEDREAGEWKNILKN